MTLNKELIKQNPLLERYLNEEEPVLSKHEANVLFSINYYPYIDNSIDSYVDIIDLLTLENKLGKFFILDNLLYDGQNEYLTTSGKIKLLKNASKLGDISIINTLQIRFCDEFERLVYEENCAVFTEAAYHNQIVVLDYFFSIIQENIGDIISADDFRTFNLLIGGGNYTIINQINELNPKVVIDAIQANNYNALSFAAENGDVEMMIYLEELVPGTIENALSMNDCTLLEDAASHGHWLFILYLEELAAAYQINFPLTKRQDIFYAAAVNGHIEILQHIKQMLPIETYKKILDKKFFSALKNSCLVGQSKTVAYLIELSPERVLKIVKQFGSYPFHMSAQIGNLDIIKLGLEFINKYNEELIPLFVTTFYEFTLDGCWVREGTKTIIDYLHSTYPTICELHVKENQQKVLLNAAKSLQISVFEKLEHSITDIDPKLLEICLTTMLTTAVLFNNIFCIKYVLQRAPDIFKKIFESNQKLFKTLVTNFQLDGQVYVIRNVKTINMIIEALAESLKYGFLRHACFLLRQIPHNCTLKFTRLSALQGYYLRQAIYSGNCPYNLTIDKTDWFKNDLQTINALYHIRRVAQILSVGFDDNNRLGILSRDMIIEILTHFKEGARSKSNLLQKVALFNLHRDTLIRGEREPTPRFFISDQSQLAKPSSSAIINKNAKF